VVDDKTIDDIVLLSEEYDICKWLPCFSIKDALLLKRFKRCKRLLTSSGSFTVQSMYVALK
jgi:hypothetical protein